MKEGRDEDILGIIPPVKTIIREGGTFSLKNLPPVYYRQDELKDSALLLASYLCPAGEGRTAPTPENISGGQTVILSLEGTPAEQAMGFPDESYTVRITPEGIGVSAPDKAGIARAVQTIRQAAFPSGELPCLTINDRPRFPWRGMHLDVSRHFYPKDYILRFIDTIALFRFNKLHLHLTDDQGWRAEIKKYPLLTEIGSMRDSTVIGHNRERPLKYRDEPYGGYYTREEMEEMVEYARIREIDIVPEIDMPGHMQAAIAAYPELGCTDMKLKPRCQWGISQHILNAKESTIEFMKDILDEIMEIFPCPYIHIGGDEALKYEWQEQRHIQERMAELGVKSEDGLQSWFISRMGEHLHSRGRRMIGWDEILEGGLPEGAIVMSWRSEAGGIEAAGQGAPVINCTSTHTYFDHYQGPTESEPLAIGGDCPLEKVYSFEPVPREIPDGKKHLVMGSQGQLWTEYIADREYLEYMAFPRALALAECLWCRPEEKDWNAFGQRLERAEGLLDNLGVNYRRRSA